jgi:hypothetical protein
VNESKLYGTTKTSFKQISPNVRLRIRHTGVVDETKHGARSRYIDAVFLEDEKGQRILSPCKNLAACSALGHHLSNGGHPYDEFGKHVVDLTNEMSAIKRFVNGTRNKTFEDSEANVIADAAKHRHHEIKHMLARMSGPRGYQLYHENWTPDEGVLNDDDSSSVRDKFVQHKFDDRLTDGLPHAYRAYKNMKNNASIDAHIDEFSESLDELSEGTWALPDNDISMKHLQELMDEPLAAGVDGDNAIGALYDLLGDDALFDHIYDASTGSPELDVRPIVMHWLEHNMPDVHAKLSVDGPKDDEEGEEAPQEEPPQDEQPEVAPPVPDPNAAPPQQPPPPAQGQPQAAPPPQQDPNQPPMDPNAPMPTESAKNNAKMLADIRRLAGLK